MNFRKRMRDFKNPLKKTTGARLLDFFRSGFSRKPLSGLRAFIRRHHFMLGFLLLALVAGALGGLYDGANKKLAERPGKVLAAAGDVWTPILDPNRSWSSIAMSADGSRLTAGVFGGWIYVSTNFGSSWTPKVNISLICVAMSADGKYQAGCGQGNTSYVSSDYGDTWTPIPIVSDFRNIAISSDGKYQTGVTYFGKQIYSSSNYGVNWIAVGPSRDWSSIAMSADGKYQTAGGNNNNGIYVSTDYGSTWNYKFLSSTNSVAMSSDGAYQTATNITMGNIIVSSNFGETWTPKASILDLSDVAVSADGSKQTAVAGGMFINPGRIYVSNDYGNNWFQKESDRKWISVAMSADGLRQAAAVWGGQIYLSSGIPPSVQINLPTNQPTLTTALNRIRIAGTSTDDVAVTQVRWVNDRGGSDTMVGTSTWLYNNVALQPGANVISVAARDAAGNWATSTVTVTYNAVTTPEFLKAVRGDNDLDFNRSIQQTNDGGYVSIGHTSIAGNGFDLYVIKFRPDGSVEWATAIGGAQDERGGYGVQQTSDGGYIAIGETRSFSGNYDSLLVKIRPDGSVEWSKTIDFGSSDASLSIRQAADGGYITTGWMYNGVNFEISVVKLKADGSLDWARTVGVPTGGLINDLGYAVDQTSDGGYVVTGRYSTGNGDVALVKFTVSGALDWIRTIGGVSSDIGYDVKQASDGGYVVVGNSISFAAGGRSFAFKMKADRTLDWFNLINTNGATNDSGTAYAVKEINDGNYIVSGASFPAGGFGSGDGYLVKINSVGGAPIWSKIIGTSGGDALYSVGQTADGGYITGGRTLGFGSNNFLMTKLDTSGNIAACANVVTPNFTTTNIPSPTITTPTPTITYPSPSVITVNPIITDITPTETNQCVSDTTAPGVISDLAITSTTDNSASLSWTAPGDDDNAGTATTYDVRYSTSAITTDAEFNAATAAIDEPAPLIAGTNQTMTVSGLAASTTYFFAIKTADEVPNWSDFSNSPGQATQASGSGSGGNVNGWGWSAGTGWINFSASNSIAVAPGATRYASAVERAVEKAVNTVARIAKFFRLNLKHNLATNKSHGLARYIDSFVDSVKLSIKIAWAQATDFGVNIDEDGQFSGYAWSDAVGWIYFGPDDPALPEYGSIASSSAPTDPKVWAQWDQTFGSSTVSGWANILALGADGWIQMSSSTIPTWADKGVGILANGDFTGWAWNAGAGGTAGIGWISFNAKLCDLNGDLMVDSAEAATTGCPEGPMQDFKVTTSFGIPLNQAPNLLNTDLIAPKWASSSAKTTGVTKRAFLEWVFRDPNNTCTGGSNDGDICVSDGECSGGVCTITDTQSAYQIILTLADGTPVIDTGKIDGVAGTANQYDASADVELNQRYRWSVTLWDNNGASSTIQYANNTAADTDENLDGDPTTFQTFTHQFPKAYFTWAPLKPSAGQNVVFDGRTSTADTGLNLTYAWNFINIIPATATGATTTATVDKSGTSTIITLTVTDDGTPNYSNSTSTNFTGKLKLPTWTEQKP